MLENINIANDSKSANTQKRLSLGVHSKPSNQVTNNLTKEELRLVHKYAQVLLKPKKQSDNKSKLSGQSGQSKNELSVVKQASNDVSSVNTGNTSNKISFMSFSRLNDVSSVSSKLALFKKAVSKEDHVYSSIISSLTFTKTVLESKI